MNPTINNPRSPFTRSKGIFGSMGSFVFTDQQQRRQEWTQCDALPRPNPHQSSAVPPNGSNRSRSPPTFPPMEDSDGFNAVPQMASMGPPPVLSSLWTGGASPDSRGGATTTTPRRVLRLPLRGRLRGRLLDDHQ
ncbi:uncharacterized protein LOC117191735 [Drosophila miranda]|uniref:uncharacterized protein LOC117191735 n=1 Tax=Drosophila miranda TaxID=7229 RepID=UPI00143F4D88|nr:uncharacterized protein LOC117191735 [Drosophila miranda]